MNALAPAVAPEEAAASLALAHQGMTPAEVAEHAVALAVVAASQDRLLRSLVISLMAIQRTAEMVNVTRQNQQIVLRRIVSLHSAGRKRAARDLLQEAAAIELAPEPLAAVDTSAFVLLLDAWPDAFNPKGTARGEHR